MSLQQLSESAPAPFYRPGETFSRWYGGAPAAAILGISPGALRAFRRREAKRQQSDDVVTWSDIEARRLGKKWLYRFGPTWRSR